MGFTKMARGCMVSCMMLLLAACLPLMGLPAPDPTVQAVDRTCSVPSSAERYECIEQHAVQTLNPEICRLTEIAIDDMCLQAVYRAANDPTICDRIYLQGVRPTCHAYYANRLVATAATAMATGEAPPMEPAADVAGLRWLECPVSSNDEEWRQVEGCFGHPMVVWDDSDRANAGERSDDGFQLRVGKDLFETHEHATPLPNLSIYTLTRNGYVQKLLLGRFLTYSPDISLTNVAGKAAWTFDDGSTAAVVYDGVDLRDAYNLDAAYAPYSLLDKLIFIGRKGDQSVVIYDGQQMGPSFDSILIAHCCEPAMYNARGGSGRYAFWGMRGPERYMVEISAG